MKGSVEVFGQTYEYDFLSGWIKYNRLKKEWSQRALAYGVCSHSHLSYFENGKKTLKKDVIEGLLKKLDIKDIKGLEDIGLIRQKLYNMFSEIESFNYESAKKIYKEIKDMEKLINLSPYNIEYKIYELVYKFFVEEKTFDDLKKDIHSIDKIYFSLNKELKFIYMLISGKIIYKTKDHDEGIKRLKAAKKIKETPLVNYFLGSAYYLKNKPLESIIYMQRALESYEKIGRYINAMWCNNYLGISYLSLKLFKRAEKHFKGAITAAKHFDNKPILVHLYNNLAALYIRKKEFKKSLYWSKKILHNETNPIIPACNYIYACNKLEKIDKCREIFDIYLVDKYKDNICYLFLVFLYYLVFHFEDDIFYQKVTKEILPYYEEKNQVHLSDVIKQHLILYLEKNRKYKEANTYYKEICKSHFYI
ncbi:MAG: transcriptional regulator [Firmicutes bacterium]|nr:transcriptional regulator [Bacillota bacterium]